MLRRGRRNQHASRVRSPELIAPVAHKFRDSLSWEILRTPSSHIQTP